MSLVEYLHLARMRSAAMSAIPPLSGDKRKRLGHPQTGAKDPKATLTGHASLFPGLGKTAVSTGFDTGLVRRSVRRYVSANASRG